MEVEFGKINDADENVFNISVPPSWSEGKRNALYVKDLMNHVIKVIPIDCDRVSLFRIKAKKDSIQEIVLTVNLIVQNYKIKPLYSNGICKENFECFAEFIVRRDDNLLEEISKMKRDREWLNIEDVMIIHLDNHQRKMKEIIDKISFLEEEKESNGNLKTIKTWDLLNKYFRMEVSKMSLIDTLKRKNVIDINPLIHDLMIEIGIATS